jgi:hypothetical protein
MPTLLFKERGNCSDTRRIGDIVLNDLNYDSKLCALQNPNENTIRQGCLELKEILALIDNASSAQSQQDGAKTGAGRYIISASENLRLSNSQ